MAIGPGRGMPRCEPAIWQRAAVAGQVSGPSSYAWRTVSRAQPPPWPSRGPDVTGPRACGRFRLISVYKACRSEFRPGAGCRPHVPAARLHGPSRAPFGNASRTISISPTVSEVTSPTSRPARRRCRPRAWPFPAACGTLLRGSPRWLDGRDVGGHGVAHPGVRTELLERADHVAAAEQADQPTAGDRPPETRSGWCAAASRSRYRCARPASASRTRSSSRR